MLSLRVIVPPLTINNPSTVLYDVFFSQNEPSTTMKPLKVDVLKSIQATRVRTEP